MEKMAENEEDQVNL